MAYMFDLSEKRVKKETWVVIAIAMIALALRVAYLWQIKSTPIFGFYAVDSQYHDIFALKILEGNLTYRDTIYLNPFYSFIIAILYSLFGHSLIVVALCQVVIDVITGIFLYMICLKVFNKKTIGLLAFFIYSLYSISIFYTAFILDATFSAFFLTGSVLLLLHSDSNEKKLLWFLSGLILGFSMLLKTYVVLLVPFIVTWLYLRKDKKFVKKTLYFVLVIVGVSAALIPFSIRNYIIMRNISPFPVNGGINFYIGNHSGATGIYTPLEGISNSVIYQTKQAIRKAQIETGKELSAPEASAYWFSKGVGFLKNHPIQYVALTGRKVYLFWNSTEMPGNENFYFCKNYVPILRSPFLSFGFVAPFAIVGFIFALKRREDKLNLIMFCIAGYSMAVIVFFIESRYRFPIVPLVVIMAAYALYEFFILVRHKKHGEFIVYGIFLLILMPLINSSAANAIPGNNLCINYNNLGVNYYERGMMPEAIAEYKKAIEINPDYAETYNNLGAVYYKLGRIEESVGFYRRALELNRNFVEAHYGLANVYSAVARNEEAIAAYRKVIDLDPSFVEAYNNLACTYLDMGDFDEAEVLFKELLKVDPTYEKAYNNLGIIYINKGRIDDAISSFKKALKVKPDYVDANNNLMKAQKRIKEPLLGRNDDN